MTKLTAGELCEGCETASSYNDSALVLRLARFVFVLSAFRLGRTVFASDTLLLVASVLLALETASSSLSDTGSCLICEMITYK